MSRTSSTHSKGRGGTQTVASRDALHPPTTSLEEDLEHIAASLGISPPEIAKMPQQLINKTMELLSFSVRQQARAVLHTTSKENGGSKTSDVDPVDTLAQQFERQDRRSRELWRLPVEVLQSEWKAILQQPPDELKNEYLELAKASAMNIEDALQVQYLLFASPEEQRVWAAMIMRKSGNERLKSHNLHVACRREPAFLQIYGQKLLNFELPLFPPTQDFQSLNTRLLAQSMVQGGEARPDIGSSVFARHREVSGSGFAPVGQLPDGTWAADTSTVEASLRRQVTALERKVVALGGQVEQRGRGRAGGRSRGYDSGSRQRGRGRWNEVVGRGDVANETGPEQRDTSTRTAAAEVKLNTQTSASKPATGFARVQ